MIQLEIRELSLQLKLGSFEEERLKTQEVRVSIRFQFQTEPRATQSDQLEDTVCYAKLCEALRTELEKTEHHTIERLSEHAVQIIHKQYGPNFSGTLLIHKVNPPIPGLLGGVALERTFP